MKIELYHIIDELIHPCIDLVNPPVPFVAKFRVTDISNDDYWQRLAKIGVKA